MTLFEKWGGGDLSELEIDNLATPSLHAQTKKIESYYCAPNIYFLYPCIFHVLLSMQN